MKTGRNTTIIWAEGEQRRPPGEGATQKKPVMRAARNERQVPHRLAGITLALPAYAGPRKRLFWGTRFPVNCQSEPLRPAARKKTAPPAQCRRSGDRLKIGPLCRNNPVARITRQQHAPYLESTARAMGFIPRGGQSRGMALLVHRQHQLMGCTPETAKPNPFRVSPG